MLEVGAAVTGEGLVHPAAVGDAVRGATVKSRLCLCVP